MNTTPSSDKQKKKTVFPGFEELTAPTRGTDPSTSQEAAGTVKVRPQAEHVLRVLNDTDEPMTDQEIHDAVHAMRWTGSEQGLRTRRHDMQVLGYIDKADEDGTTEYGKKCGRFVITERGKQLLETLNKTEKEENK